MIACPICARPFPPGLTLHYRRELWTPAQILLVQRLRGLGIGQKAVGRVLGCPPATIAGLEARLRAERKVAA